LSIAHGEGWELAASRAISEMTKKILEEYKDMKTSVEDNGTFQLQYNPSCRSKKSISIQLPTPNDPQFNKPSENVTVNSPSVNHDDDIKLRL